MLSYSAFRSVIGEMVTIQGGGMPSGLCIGRRWFLDLNLGGGGRNEGGAVVSIKQSKQQPEPGQAWTSHTRATPATCTPLSRTEF